MIVAGKLRNIAFYGYQKLLVILKKTNVMDNKIMKSKSLSFLHLCINKTVSLSFTKENYGRIL